MTAHHDILRVASARATSAAASAPLRQTTRHNPDMYPEHEIDAVLVTLPDAAEKGAKLSHDLHHGHFLFASWSPEDLSTADLYKAVARRLDMLGIKSRFETTRRFFADLPYELYVSFESLHEVAARETRRREGWLDAMREAWLARAGAGAEVKVVTTAAAAPETLVLTAPEGNVAMADPADRRPAHLRVLEHRAAYDADKPVPAVIAEAVDALRLPAWTFEAVQEAWKAKSRGGDVVRSRGLWKGTAVRNVATMIFRGPAVVGSGVEVTFAVDDVHSKSAAEIAELAYRDFTAAAFEAQAKPPVPAGPAVHAAEPPAARAARPQPGVHTRFGAQSAQSSQAPLQLDVPFSEPEKAAAAAKAAFPRAIQIPGGVVRAVKDPEEGVAFRIETEVDGAVTLSGNAGDATEGADTLALFVEDAWREAAAKQGAAEDVAGATEPPAGTPPAAETKPAKGAGARAAVAKGTAGR